MDLELIYELAAKNIINELKRQKRNCVREFFKSFSCKSSCSIENDQFDIVFEHIKKIEKHRKNIESKNNVTTI